MNEELVAWKKSHDWYRLNLTGRSKEFSGGPFGTRKYLESSYKILWVFSFTEWVPVSEITYFDDERVVISGQ